MIHNSLPFPKNAFKHLKQSKFEWMHVHNKNNNNWKWFEPFHRVKTVRECFLTLVSQVIMTCRKVIGLVPRQVSLYTFLRTLIVTFWHIYNSNIGNVHVLIWKNTQLKLDHYFVSNVKFPVGHHWRQDITSYLGTKYTYFKVDLKLNARVCVDTWLIAEQIRRDTYQGTGIIISPALLNVRQLGTYIYCIWFQSVCVIYKFINGTNNMTQ